MGMRKFMRTRGAQPHALTHLHHNGQTALPKTNGHANGISNNIVPVNGRREEPHSTLSRYWSGSEGSGRVLGEGLWEDPEFPATSTSLGDKKFSSNVVWMRPHELCTRPAFRGEGFNDGVTEDENDDDFAARWSIEVGAVGDSSLCCAVAALALTPRLLDRVIPPQTFKVHYNGSFKFNFWVFGAWREVAVDDRLPTRAGRLITSHNALPDDFTLPLLEKAYAKLYGSYVALRVGSVSRALQDLSGGIVQSFSLVQQPKGLTAQVLNSAVPRSTLLVATVAQEKESGWRRLRNGLISGQAYCVTGLARVRSVNTADGEGALVRVRAVSGLGEWAGPWARGSAEWRALAEADRDLLARRADRPGDFWMSFPDFARAFTTLVLVHVGPDDWLIEPALHGKRPWRAVLARRRWRRGYNAGGPPSCIETTSTNPQFHVQIPRTETGGARKCHVVVSVTQQYGTNKAGKLRAIGFAVYEIPAGGGPRRGALRALAGLRALDVTHESRAREVATFFTLPAGQYLVVPHTRRPHTEAAFLLRIFTDEQTDVWEVNDDNLIIPNIGAEFLDDDQSTSPELQMAITNLFGKKDIEEVDARALRGAVRRASGGWRAARAACGALVAARDAGARGGARARDGPPLVARLLAWRAAYTGLAPSCSAASSYRLRALLWAAGVAASNKVLECLVMRFAKKNTISLDAYLIALAKLHLAHERFRCLEAKLKSNPISLEEMILMTIYS
ncbi:calpain-9-like isoform X2 [Bombyx mandarina]|uniref:Calpain-9-like isoform X2 n=1 Tax=Bombyx mandarina TaxID=7092 RepID=A0A6J2KKJ3_BOMMA|nr:calpain-9-like isoform X2 [Bombyx mandarina]